MRFIPVTDKVNPFGALHNADRTDSTAVGYRNHFLTQIEVNQMRLMNHCKGSQQIHWMIFGSTFRMIPTIRVRARPLGQLKMITSTILRQPRRPRSRLPCKRSSTRLAAR